MPLTKPSTLGELQLYKVLQRANLLSYYEAFISQGGDDVQQLCEAGEEEFLEIMALVEMACKPLHVRRLQKALQEWVTRPAIFRGTNMHYLPAQSISLTSLGIDTNDLIWPPQNSPRNRTSPSLSQDRDGAQSPEEDTPNRPVSTGGSTAATPKSSNGVGNVFRLDEKPGILNGHPSAVDVLDEGESPDDAAVSVFMQTLVQKYIQSPISSMERKDIVAQLQADQSHRDLAAAIGNKNRPRMETLARDFIKLERNHEDGTSSRHEVLIVDAAVKLCMSDERWFLKKTELLATAEIIVSEVEAKFPGRRRSATHLHGSCSQSRVQEVNKQLQDLRTQRTNLHKQLQEDQGSKNSILGCIARDEAVLLQEKKALKKKLLLGTKQIPPMSVGMESSFSSDLAGYYNSDLAKAHNLSFGNFQPSTSSWKPMENGVSSSKMTPESTTTSASPNHTGTITPELLGTSDVKNQGSVQNSERTSSGVFQIKRESDKDADAFPSKSNGIIGSSKRKLSTGSFDGEASSSKRLLSSTDAEME